MKKAESNFLLAYLQAHSVKALHGYINSSNKSLFAESLSELESDFLSNLLRNCKTPIPLYEASDLNVLESRCSKIDAIVYEEGMLGRKGSPAFVEKHHIEALQEYRKTKTLKFTHFDACKRACSIFIGDHDFISKASDWLNESELKQENSKESDQKSEREFRLNDDGVDFSHDKLQLLHNLGFPIELCKRALETTRGNETLAANWLFENANSEKDSKEAHVSLEDRPSNEIGVDFFQECGDGNSILEAEWKFQNRLLEAEKSKLIAHDDRFSRLILGHSLPK